MYSHFLVDSEGRGWSAFEFLKRCSGFFDTDGFGGFTGFDMEETSIVDREKFGIPVLYKACGPKVPATSTGMR